MSPMHMVRYKDPSMEVVKYPYTREDFRADYPYISLSAGPISPGALSGVAVPVAVVHQTRRPEYDEINQVCVEVDPVWDAKTSRFLQQWEVRDVDQEKAEGNKERRYAHIEAEIKHLLDEVVRLRKYDNFLSAASYVNSMNPSYASEALAAVHWRDLVWATWIQIQTEVNAGIREVPTVEEVLNELPQIQWPE